MKKIIGGKTYDTNSATLLGEWSNGHYTTDFNYCNEGLYRTPRGNYFLHGVGGASSKYSQRSGNNWAGGEQIIPLIEDEAKAWAEEHLTGDEYEAAFGAPDEEADDDLVSRERVNLSLAKGTAALLRKLSKETGTPMARMVDEAIAKIYGA